MINIYYFLYYITIFKLKINFKNFIKMGGVVEGATKVLTSPFVAVAKLATG